MTHVISYFGDKWDVSDRVVPFISSAVMSQIFRRSSVVPINVNTCPGIITEASSNAPHHPCSFSPRQFKPVFVPICSAMPLQNKILIPDFDTLLQIGPAPSWIQCKSLPPTARQISHTTADTNEDRETDIQLEGVRQHSSPGSHTSLRCEAAVAGYFAE